MEIIGRLTQMIKEADYIIYEQTDALSKLNSAYAEVEERFGFETVTEILTPLKHAIDSVSETRRTVMAYELGLRHLKEELEETDSLK